ncbi:MAG: peptidoglycan-binding domain-containing protein [Pseudomonadota bacterium]
MRHRSIGILLCLGGLANAVQAEHPVSMTPLESVDQSGGCCLSIEGETARVLIAPSADAIRRIQAELGIKGFNPGPIDGIFGPRTERAMRTFQRDEGLMEGLLTVETLSRLGISVRAERRLRSSLQGHRPMPSMGERGTHASQCCGDEDRVQVPTVTRRLIRSSPAQQAQLPSDPPSQVLPNYVSETVRHDVEGLTWPGKTKR